jgi:glycosyltransferase involved in cell wall biosynthesis
MHALHLNFLPDREARPPRRLLEAWYSLGQIADAVASSGTRVTVLLASPHRARLRIGAVNYVFLPSAAGGCLAAGKEFAALVETLQPDVCHVHGLGFPEEVQALRAAVPAVPILLQDHADRVPRIWRRARLRRGLAAADAVSFCAEEQAEPFRRAGLLPPGLEVFEISESTSGFSCGDRHEARSACGLSGDPCVLWLGHLDANKDPLTVLEGVALAARQLPGLRLWCVFGQAPLRAKVETLVRQDAALGGRVTLLGRVPHEHVQTLMRAADLFVLGSHREGSGYSLIEALSCGLPPVVTDIPSFRALTGDGVVGRLWRPGDARACAAALIGLAARPAAEARTSVRAHFDAHLSTTALGQRFSAAYAAMLGRRAHAA